MSGRTSTGTVLVLATMLACASVRAEPPRDPDLQRLTGQLAQLDADPSLGQLGAVDRLKAREALDALAQTSPRSEDRAPALYIAERRVAAAQFAAQAELAERQVDQLDREHDRILLEASRRDADRARQEAERLRMQDKAREEETQRADAERDAQQQQAAGIANDESDQARALAEARAKASALAQQEAALTGAASSSKPPMAPGAEPRGPSIEVAGLVFAPGSASLRNDPHAKAQIKALVAFVRDHADASIRIEAHTDNSVNARKSLDLSQERAEALKNILRAAGVAADRVQAVGLGAEQPVASNATAAGRARNNRAAVIALRNTNQ